MESSPSSTSLQYQFRSISLPSRLHPHNTRIDFELTKLKAWQSSLVSSTVPTSGEIIRTGLVGLTDLYSCVEELIHSPTTRQALVHHRNGVLVEEALEGSIGWFLDSCSVARDLLLMMKENVQDLQSVLRRKGGDLIIERNINAYASSKKKVKKESAKCLRALKKMEKQIESCSPFDVNYHLSDVIRALREVSIVTISVLQLFFLFMSAPDSRTRPAGWSLIKKLVATRPIEHKTSNEIGSVDVVLQSLNGYFPNNNPIIDVEMARRRLQVLGDSMGGLEDGFECLYRQLIRNRVSLLNIFAH